MLLLLLLLLLGIGIFLQRGVKLSNSMNVLAYSSFTTSPYTLTLARPIHSPWSRTPLYKDSNFFISTAIACNWSPTLIETPTGTGSKGESLTTGKAYFFSAIRGEGVYLTI